MAAFDGYAKRKGNTPLDRTYNALIDENQALEDAFSALGKVYLQAHGDDPEPAFKDHIDTIKTAKRRVEIYAELLNRMRGVRICKKCGTELSGDSSFCTTCGSKMEPLEPLSDGINVYCNTCGSAMPIGQKFCSTCGGALPTAGAPAAAPVRNDRCRGCGNVLAPGQKFCNVCGKKVEETVGSTPVNTVPEAAQTAEEVSVPAAEEPAEEEKADEDDHSPEITVPAATAPEIPEVTPEIPEVPEIPDEPEVPEEPEEPEEPEAPEEPEVPEEPEAPEEPEVPEEPEAPEAPEEPEAPVIPDAPEIPASSDFKVALYPDDSDDERTVRVRQASGKPEATLNPAAPATCPNCGKVLAPGMKFCTGCGFNLSSAAVNPDPAPVKRTCPNCGKVVSDTAVFCTGCGTRLGQ